MAGERSRFARTRSSLQTDHLIPARENLFHYHALAAAQVRQAFLHALDIRLGSDGTIAAPSRLHSCNVFALQIDHLACSEHRPGALELAATKPRVQIGFDLRERSFAHGSPQRVT